MDFMNKQQPFAQSSTAQSATYDAGLRAHMLRTYNYIGIGLAISAFLAYLTAHVPALAALVFSPGIGTLIQFAPLGILFFLMFKAQTMSRTGLLTTFYVFAGLKGLALSYIFLMYGMGDITRSLLITAIVFGSMSLYGYTTKRDLTSIGFFLMAGVWAVFLSMLAVWVLGAFGVDTGSAGVLLFGLIALIVIGLTAYETQKLKQSYYVLSGDALDKVSIMTALNLYINIIIIFQWVLSIVGGRE